MISTSKMRLQLFAMLMATFSLVSARAFDSHNLKEIESMSPCTCTTTVTRTQVLGHHARQNTCLPPTTVTSYIAVVDVPPTVTVAGADPGSISQEFASASSIDSIVVVNSIEDRPTGDHPDTMLPVFTHTASGPAIVASEAPHSGVSVIYIFQSIGASVPVATTTVTVTPFRTPINAPQAAVSLSSAGWNGTQANLTEHSSVLGTGSSSFSKAQSTLTLTSYITTQSQYVNTTTRSTTVPPTIPSLSGYYGPNEADSTTTSVTDLRKRQICTLIFAQIGGNWASWCNNWDGSRTLSYSTYETTVVLTSIPGASQLSYSVVTATSTTTSPLPNSVSTSSSAETTSTTSSSSQTQAPTATILSSTDSAVSNNTQIQSSTSSAPPSQSSCGQVGTFIIDFDDLPQFSTSDPENESSAPPVFNPYEHFYWSAGYGYGPPPPEPYVAHGGQRLAEYNPASEPTNTGSPDAGAFLPGSFGAGPRAYNNVYWFDAHSVWIGCNNTGSSVCDFVATGYRWIPADRSNLNSVSGTEVLAFTQHFHPPPCLSNKGCQLSQVFFHPDEFSGLSSLNFYARVAGVLQGFYIDTLELAWSNNTCEAGLERVSSRK